MTSTLEDFEILKTMNEGERLLYIASRLRLLSDIRDRLENLQCVQEAKKIDGLTTGLNNKADKTEFKILSTRVVIALSIAGGTGFLLIGALIVAAVNRIFG